MALQQVSALINVLVQVYDAHQHVLQCLSLRDLRIYSATCKDVHVAVKQFIKNEYNIDSYLLRFLLQKDIYTFREAQHMTNTIIAGSFALQFFARLNFPSSDMELYTISKEAQFMCRSLELFGCVAKAKDGSNTTSVALLDDSWKAQFFGLSNQSTDYVPRGVLTVINFASPTGRSIQVIVTTIPTVEVLMNYYSTNVMNFITSSHAYSLYGWETFNLGLTLYTCRYPRCLPQIITKYAHRGWEAITNGNQAADRMVFKPMLRRVDDRLTWKLKLKPNYSKGFEKPQAEGAEDVKERALEWSLAYDSMGFPELKPRIVTALPMISPL